MLGTVGVASGPIGAAIFGALQGARAWVEDVNRRGGLNGHHVRLIEGDDAGDPNKALGLVRRMVEQDKVQAFFVDHSPTTGQTFFPYLEQKQIPVIGSCDCGVPMTKSTMGFDVGFGAGDGVAWAHYAALMALSDKRKVSILYCGESPTCNPARQSIRQNAGRTGLEIVHEAQTTITQPDYTAEVLSARNAGAEALVLILDNASVIRVMRSAHRQGYSPLVSGQHSTHDQAFTEFGGKEVEGFMAGASHPHWTSPLLADYMAALKRQPGAKPSSMSIGGWTAGKLLEVIAKGFPDNTTTADLLKGLYGLRGETLGGLVPPLTYVEGKSHEGVDWCAVPVRVDGGKFVAPGGDKFTCFPGWEPVKK